MSIRKVESGTESRTANPAVVKIRSVSKRFPGVQALEDVSLDIRPGEVHAVAGENGAGKSTLMKLLSQLERPSDGTIEVDGKPVRFRNPRHAQRLGIAMVHQEFALAPHLTIADNIALGRERSHAGLIVRGSEKQRARELLERVKLDIEPRRRVATLSVADQQRVEIAKALAVDAKVPDPRRAHGHADRARDRRSVRADRGAQVETESRSSTSRTGSKRSCGSRIE